MAPQPIFITATTKFTHYYCARTPKVHGWMSDRQNATSSILTSLRIFIFLLINLTLGSFISLAPLQKYCAMSSIYQALAIYITANMLYFSERNYMVSLIHSNKIKCRITWRDSEIEWGSHAKGVLQWPYGVWEVNAQKQS